MGHSHDHNHGDLAQGNAKKLALALGLTASFLVIEFIAAIWTQSLALLSDAAHMLTDVIALAIALIAIKVGQRPADNKRTFGYQRFEVLAALFNASLLFLVAIYVLYEAYIRLSQPPEIQSMGMLIVASIGLLVNLIAMKILFSSSNSSLNMKGAYLEVLSDALGSVGVILAAILIYFTGWYIVDSIVAVLIGIWILPRTWLLMKQSIHILLEGVPEEIDIEQLRADLLALDGVEDIHKLKVWAMSAKNIHLTVHLYAPRADRKALYQEAVALLSHDYKITEITLQLEDELNCITQHDDHTHAHDHQHEN